MTDDNDRKSKSSLNETPRRVDRSSHPDFRRQAEEALQESPDKFRVFSEQVLMGVVLIQDDVIKYCNQAMSDILEYSIEEILGWGPKGYARVIHPDYLEFAMEQARKKQAGEKDVVPEYSYKLVTKSGLVKWVDQFSRTMEYDGRPADLVTMVDMTVQKEAEEALREREQQYRNLIETMNDGFLILDTSCRINYANGRMSEMLGFERNDMIGARVASFMDSANSKILYQECQGKKSIEKKSFEISWRKKDGEALHSIISISPIITSDPEELGYNAVVTDITSRILSEEAIRKSEARYRELFDNAMEGIVVVDENETIVFCNDAFASIIELDSSRKAIGRNMMEFLIAEQRHVLLQQTARRREKRSSRYEIEIVTAKKNKKTLLSSVSPRLDKEGNFVGSFGTVLDITERKEAEERLMKTRDELDHRVKERTIELAEANRQLKKSIFDLYNIFELSRNFNSLLEYKSLLDAFISASMSRMGSSKACLYVQREVEDNRFDLERYKGKGNIPDEYFEADPDGAFCRHLSSLNRPIRIKEVVEMFTPQENFPFINRFPNGLVVPLVYQTRLRGILILSGRDAERTYLGSDLEFLAILANQTVVSIENARLYESEREMQNELRKTQELLARSEKSAALGELSAKVAHEINNPLGIIKNYLLLTGRSLDNPEKMEEHIGVVRGEIDRIAGIVRQLLDFHRPIMAKFSLVDPRKVIDETLALMKFQLDENGIKVETEYADSVPEIKIWPEGIKQVLINLLMNARDAVGPGGEICIGASRCGGGVYITVEDNGPGIPEDKVESIFESFYTTKSSTGGTGLGLSVCKRIIKNHNGSITFSNTDKGGCFKIKLPIEQEERDYDWRI